jgi:hypothetical protein
MNIIKTNLRNRMNDEWLKDFGFVLHWDPEKIKRTFQSMEDRKMSLPLKRPRCS